MDVGAVNDRDGSQAHIEESTQCRPQRVRGRNRGTAATETRAPGGAFGRGGGELVGGQHAADGERRLHLLVEQGRAQRVDLVQ